LIFFWIATGRINFSKDACDTLEPFLTRRLVGQDASLLALTDAVCDHLTTQIEGTPSKPLVVSIHGPPGVGKTYFHQLAGHALYNGDVPRKKHCPGRDCPGYKVLFGMDYTVKDRDEQHRMIQQSLLQQVQDYPQSFLVIEEYDKLDCYMRGFFRQILQGGIVGNQSLGNSIVILESNLGYSVLHRMLETAGDRNKIQLDDAQRALKDMIFKIWRQQDCEAFSDSQKLLRTIDLFLPFYPLEKEHIKKLFEMKLEQFSDEASRTIGQPLTYNASLLGFLVQRVEFDGKYPIEGGKEVNTVTTGYLSRPFRKWIQGQNSMNSKGKQDEHQKGKWTVEGQRVSIQPFVAAA